MPPQVRPTAKASSSLTPYRSSVGVPVATTSFASSYTAPSTQPPETLPTAVPSGPTSIDAPGGRGAERQVPTTVPTPTVSPACHQPIRSSRTSRTGDHSCQFLERGQAVPGDEVVNAGQRRDHARGQRLVAGPSLVRVDPDDGVRQPLQPGHLLGQQLRAAAFPAVAADDDDGAPCGAPLSP